MPLSIEDVTRIAQTAAAATSPQLTVAGVTLGGGEGSEYVEVLVSLDGCDMPPCQVEVGVFRNVEETRLHRDITRKLRQHLDEHVK